MPKPWRLTRNAEAALTDIARWTLEAFGPRQARAYEDDLIETCRGIASGTRMSQSCQHVMDPDLPEALRFTRAGQHIVVFVEQDDLVIIVDVLHGQSNLLRRLQRLSIPER